MTMTMNAELRVILNSLETKAMQLHDSKVLDDKSIDKEVGSVMAAAILSCAISLKRLADHLAPMPKGEPYDSNL